MIYGISNCYGILPSDMNGDRLDFVFHHPELEDVRDFRADHQTRLASEIVSPEYGLSLSGRAEGEVGFVNVQHLLKNGEITPFPEVFLNDSPDGKLLEPGDILLARSGSVGRVAMVSREFSGFAFGSFCLRLRMQPQSKLMPEFVVQFLNSRFGQRQIQLLKTGSIQMNINSRQIQDIAVPHLELTRQSELVTMTKAIEFEARQLEIAAAKVRQAAADILPQELELSFAATENIRYFFKGGSEKPSLAFVVPADAVDDRLHYLFFHPRFEALDELQQRYSCTTLGAPGVLSVPIRRGEQPDYDENGDVLVLKTVDLKNGSIGIDDALRVSSDFFESKAGAQIQKGDVLIASAGYGSMGKVDVFENDQKAMISGELLSLRASSNYDPYFLAYYLRSYLGQLQIEKWFTGSSGQIHLNEGDVAQFIIPAADENGVPLAEQQRIASLITVRLEEARLLEAQATNKWAESKAQFEALLLGEAPL